MPHALSLNLRFEGDATDAVIHRAGVTRDAQPSFEITRHTNAGMSYLVAYNEKTSGLAINGADVVAEIELPIGAATRIDVEPLLTMLSNQGGTQNATVANGALQIKGTVIGAPSDITPERGK